MSADRDGYDPEADSYRSWLLWVEEMRRRWLAELPPGALTRGSIAQCEGTGTILDLAPGEPASDHAGGGR